MITSGPSCTALAAAVHRAAHQILEQGKIFSDPLAVRILGVDADEAVRKAAADPSVRALRLFIAVRTRFAEDALAVALTRGVRQVVVLGAGLDTYAYRNSAPQCVRIFEVDHPATQSWKRQRLADTAIAIPPGLTFAPVDFERETLETGLRAAGFDFAQRTFFTWLGVVPYLTEAAVLATLRFIASLSGGADVVFDYCNPISGRVHDQQAVAHEILAERVADVGEPFMSYFERQRISQILANLRFSEVEDLGPAQIRARYFANRRGSSADQGGHILRAATD